MKNNILNKEAWETLFQAKQPIPNSESIKELFNILYERISKGAALVKRSDGLWYLETVDMDLLPLNSQAVDELVNNLSEESKAYLRIDGNNATYESYNQYIRMIPDFPKEGIKFIDWLPIMNHPVAYQRLLHDCARLVRDFKFTKIAALESRGFFLGVPLANIFGVGFVPIRKKGKLPGKVKSESYALEYGTDTIEIQEDMIDANDAVLVVDDLIATGGSINAANDLVSKFTSNIQDLFLIELSFLKGGQTLKYPYKSLIKQ